MSSTSLIIYWKRVSSDNFFNCETMSNHSPTVFTLLGIILGVYTISPLKHLFWKGRHFFYSVAVQKLLFTSDNYYFPSPYVLVVYSLFWEAASLFWKVHWHFTVLKCSSISYQFCPLFCFWLFDLCENQTRCSTFYTRCLVKILVTATTNHASNGAI